MAITLMVASQVLTDIGQNEDFIQSQIIARIAYLGVAIFTLITSAFETCVGVIGGICTLLTLGCFSTPIKVFEFGIISGRWLLSMPFTFFLKALNPQAETFLSREDAQCETKNQTVTQSTFFHKTFFSFNSEAKQLFSSNSFFLKHCASRGMYVVMLVALLLSRVADTIIGTIAAVFALITMGHVNSFNIIATKHLILTGAIHDIFFCAIKMLNPGAELEPITW